ncbi:MAG: glycosyltransferase family 2 protein [Proteobacteria bacterium]|nr:glycosyltransferase family 2 protein [Pseudomonadota bacterium]
MPHNHPERDSYPRPKNPLFSFIVPAYREEKNISNFLISLKDSLDQLSIRYEIIAVDDGSPDNTGKLMLETAQKIPMKCVLFSRNFGKEQALTAGLMHASGDAAILMDADFQHPFETIEKFISYWHQGYDMIYGVRMDRGHDGYARRSFTYVFYKLLNWIAKIPIEPNAGDFRLLDRKAIDALNTLPERTRFMKGLYAWVGFKSIGIPFDVTERQAGQSSYNLSKLSNLAAIGLTSFSTLPLRISMLVGVLTSFFAFSYGFWIVMRTLLFGADLPGWSTLVAAVLFLGGLQLIAMGILGEYISHIFTEVKNRPLYIVSEIYDSTLPKQQNTYA